MTLGETARTPLGHTALHIVAAVVDVHLLGPLQVVDATGRQVDVAGDLQRGLLALLALEAPASVSNDRILDELWKTELRPSDSSLHVTVSRLRKALGEDLVRRVTDSYVLDVPAANTDIARFRRHAQRGSQFLTLGHPGKAAEAFRQALAQWRGAALVDLRRFEFAEEAGRRLEEERLAVLEALMEAELLVGDHALVVGELSGLVERFPFRERLWRLLMLALYRSGRQAEALRAYARVKAVLADELGLEPSLELSDLEQRILLHDPALVEVSEPASLDWMEVPELVNFSPGEMIVEEGVPADAVYWIESGEVEVFREGTDDSGVLLARLGPGRYFGELASLLATARTASVRASAPTTLSVHTVSSFRRRLGAERSQDRPSVSTSAEVRALMGRGQFLHAYDIASRQLQMGSADTELRYLAVLALARSAATTQARRLHDAFGLASVDPDSVPAGLAEDIAALGPRLDKDIALARRGDERRQWARRSAKGYEKAVAHHRSAYLAVNAATMWLVAGDRDKATASAQAALAMLVDRRPGNAEDRYWAHVTEAEAALVVGDTARAGTALARAGEASESWAARASTLRQLRLVCELEGRDPSLLSPIANPTVVHYCGHRIGPPEEGNRIPPDDEARIGADLKRAFSQIGAGLGFGSLAAGADILAAEALLEHGAELHVTLPFDRDEFVRTSVAPAGPGWVQRFERCLASAAGVVTAVTGEYLDDPTLFDFCARVAMGDALVRARHLEAPVHQVAVWDGVDTGLVAGTSVDIAHWQASGHPSTVINAERRGERPAPSQGLRQIRALVFGDFAGFSRLSDAQVMLFQEKVMSELAVVVKDYDPHLLSGRTWGDGIHLVFSDVGAAAECALAMQAAVTAIDFEKLGLAGLRGMRLAAHASPVFEGWDPISGATLFFGAGLTQTARIEPGTPEGEVYVTHPFAALAVLAGDKAFACQYVGTLPTAKGYGELPLYALHRRV